MVDYSSLENYRTERYRGFESLSLRKKINSSLVSSELFLFINPSNPETQNDSSDKLRAGATFCIQAKVCLRRF